MAHELSNNNGIYEMAYLLSDGIPWHGLGQAVNDDEADNLFIWGNKSNMSNFEFLTSPVLFFDEADDDVRYFGNKVVAYRNDTREPIDIVSNNYKIVQPREVLQFFDDVIRGMGYKMTSAGVLFGGRKFWAQANTGQSRDIRGVDKVNSSILLATGFDGATIGMETTTRVVCNNTLRQATKDKTGAVKVSHSTTFDANAMKEQLGLSPEMFNEWCDIAEGMSNVKVSPEEALEFFGDVFDIYEQDVTEHQERLEAAQANPTVQTVNQLFLTAGLGRDYISANGTLWGAVNAVTEYIDHHRNTRTIDARLNGAWFGTQANIKQRAWDEAMLKAA